MRANPFDSLYITETVSPGVFVQLFSPLLIQETLSLFQPGNVVLTGTQGSGKSMLLGLLKPEVQVAYAKVSEDFPLNGLAPPFIGAGINLTRSGVMDFGQRRLPGQEEHGATVLQTYFADFLNYSMFAGHLGVDEDAPDRPAGCEALKVDHENGRLDSFAAAFARTTAGREACLGCVIRRDWMLP